MASHPDRGRGLDARAVASQPRARCGSCGAAMQAGGRFCAFCGSPAAGAAKAAPQAAAAPHRIERRQLTVVFCDLVGSSALATSMEPEDFAGVIGAFHRCVTEVARGFGGFVAQYLGDGVLVYFGYPRANEDDAERAVSAALAVVDAVSALAAGGRGLRVRVGVATGVTVVGDVAGADEPRGIEVVGEAPNLAARLQALAAPGTVAVADGVRRLLGNLFRWEDLGRHGLKGWDEPVQAWQALRPSGIADRFEAKHPNSAGPLVGRARELDRLLGFWRDARGGKGRLVLVTGEPGVGKSRLVAELMRATAAEPHLRRRYHFSPHHQDAPLHPLMRHLEQSAGFAAGDGPDAKRAKLRAALPEMPDDEFALVAELMLLPPDGRSQALQLTPQLRRRRTFQALLAQLARLARGKAVLTVVEDAHWSDPTSAELLGMVARRAVELPILDVVTARPDFRPDWADGPGIARIDLEPLSPHDSAEVVRWTAGGAPLPRDVVRGILARSDGVPLHLEELTRAVVEAAEHPAPAGAASGGRAAHPVPASIQASLLARLDRLGEAREVAEVAAAVGREFTAGMLGEVTGLPRRALGAALARLVASGMVVAAGGPHDRHYRFKHALIQDAAYGTIVRGRRRELHARIARVLDERLPQGATAKPQLLAHHFTEAGDAERAAAWWLRAGLQSLRQSAAPEALEQLRRGLEVARTLPAGAPRDRQELDLTIARARASVLASGHAADASGEAFAAARALCERLGAPPQLLTVLHGQWTHAFMRGDLSSALWQAEDLLAHGAARDDPEWMLVGYHCKGMTSMPMGDFAAAREYLGRGIALSDPRRRGPQAEAVVGDPQIIMRGDLGWTLLCLGRFADARREFETTIGEAREVGHAFILAHALSKIAYFNLNARGPEAALPLVDEMRLVSEEHGIAFYHAVALAYRGWCLGMLGDVRAGREAMRLGVENYRATGSRLYLPSLLRMEAEVLLLDRDAGAGLARIEEAARLKDETGAHWDGAEIERVRGEALLALGGGAAAEAALRSAVAMARARGARWFELRAATSLARLLAGTARTADAETALAPLVADLEHAGEAADLDSARRLLLALRPAAMARTRPACAGTSGPIPPDLRAASGVGHGEGERGASRPGSTPGEEFHPDARSDAR